MSKQLNYLLIPAMLRYDIVPFHLVERISMIGKYELKHFLTKQGPREMLDMKYMAYYLLKKHFELSSNEIGEIFGRDHGAILNGLKRFDEMFETNTEFRNRYNQLILALNPRLQ